MNHLKTLSTATLIALATTAAQATLIHSEDFDIVGAPSALGGTTTDVGGGTWDAGSAFLTNGTVNGTGTTNGSTSFAFLDFTPVQGKIYELQASITLSSTSANDGIGFGFAQGNNPDLIEFLDPPTNTVPNPNFGNSQPTSSGSRHWNSGVAGTGYIRMFGSSGGAANTVRYNSTAEIDNAVRSSFSAGSTNIYKIILDASDTDWTAEFFFNGSSIISTTFVDGALAEDISYVGFSYFDGGNSSLNSVDSFTLTEVPVPGSLALLGLGGLLIARRRRDN